MSTKLSSPMNPMRSRFPAALSMALALLLAAGCIGRGAQRTVPATASDRSVPTQTSVTPTPTWVLVPPTAVQSDAARATVDSSAAQAARVAAVREKLRACWLALDELQQASSGDSTAAYQAREWLLREHQLALDELVAADQMAAPVARLVQLALAETALQVSTPYVPFAGADPTLADVRLGVRAQLAEQAMLLIKGDALSPEAIASAQALMARDIAFLSLTFRQVNALDDSQCRAADGSHHCPSFDQLDLDIPPESAAAARFLVEVLRPG